MFRQFYDFLLKFLPALKEMITPSHAPHENKEMED